jgi:hypothetical protein
LPPLLPWCSVSNPPLSLVSFRTSCSWDIIRGRSIATMDTRYDEYWSAQRIISWVTTELLVFKYVCTTKARCSTDQRSVATEMLWVSLEGRSRTTFPSLWFHSQLCYQIVRYFCRTLYKHQAVKIQEGLRGGGGIKEVIILIFTLREGK